MNSRLKFKKCIEDMETEVHSDLYDLLNEHGHGFARRKWMISENTGIPEDILTVILKRLKTSGKVKIIPIFDEHTGLPNGSGYCLNTEEDA